MSNKLILVTLVVRIEIIQKMHTDERLKAWEDVTCSIDSSFIWECECIYKKLPSKKQWQWDELSYHQCKNILIHLLLWHCLLPSEILLSTVVQCGGTGQDIFDFSRLLISTRISPNLVYYISEQMITLIRKYFLFSNVQKCFKWMHSPKWRFSSVVPVRACIAEGNKNMSGPGSSPESHVVLSHHVSLVLSSRTGLQAVCAFRDLEVFEQNKLVTL